MAADDMIGHDNSVGLSGLYGKRLENSLEKAGKQLENRWKAVGKQLESTVSWKVVGKQMEKRRKSAENRREAVIYSISL